MRAADALQPLALVEDEPEHAGIDLGEVEEVAHHRRLPGGASLRRLEGGKRTVEAVDRVEIRPLVSGTLTAVHFKDGNLVKKGDVLFTIDPRPYAAESE